MEQRSATQRVKAWLAKPYSDDMSVAGWFAFLALLSILAFLWSRVLSLVAKSIGDA